MRCSLRRWSSRLAPLDHPGVAVVGAGAVGLSAILTTGLWGASKVIAVDSNKFRLEKALEEVVDRSKFDYTVRFYRDYKDDLWHCTATVGPMSNNLMTSVDGKGSTRTEAAAAALLQWAEEQ